MENKKIFLGSLFVIGFLLVAFCIGLFVKGSENPAPGKAETDTGVKTPQAETEDSTAPETTPAETAPADTDKAPRYIFGTPLEESEPPASDDAFHNAVFLGDSRTEGLQLWGGIRQGDYLWHRGMTVFRVDDENYTFGVAGEALTMVGVLQKKQYEQIYIMIGVNELGYPAASYEKGLGTFLDKVIAAQPEAVIYLQTLPPLNDELAQKYLAAYENNKNICVFNEIIVRMAAEKRVVLLDVATAYRDEEGQLPAELTKDGCHFTAEGYGIWADYLRRHRIDKARYFDSRGASD